MFWKTSQNSQINTRSSHPEVFCEMIFLKILQNSQKNFFAGISFLIKLLAGILKLSQAATRNGLYKNLLLEISQISQEDICVEALFQ